MSSDIAVKVESLSKCFHIYNRPRDRLLQLFVRGRKRYYKEFWALKNVSFEVKKGETVGIVGHNGSGKSTLLQMICGTLTPTSGSVQTHGRIAALLELGSGFNPEFTGRENVYLNAAVLGLSKAEIDARFDDIAAFADIGDFVEQPVKTYSSGMTVRLAFAVQATVDPDILIVDEALAVGDEKFQRKCFARLEELKSRGTSIIFVSHSGPQVVELCDRAILMNHGVCLMDATPMRVVRAYQELVYAPQEEQSRLIREYLTSGPDSPGSDKPPGEASSAEIVLAKSEVFDPGLVPEATTTYPIQGAEIQSIQILDVDGRLVNVLQPGRDYQFVVAARFLLDIEGISFGIHIRTPSGLVVSGQRYPEEGKNLECVRAGSAVKIKFAFRMGLLPGVYFVGGGIWSDRDPGCIHRILDALMFRVLPLGRSTSFGYVDLSPREPSLELKL